MRLATAKFTVDHATLRRGTYPDGSTKLTVLTRYGAVLCDATICLRDAGEKPAAGHVFIREWGETKGILHALQDAEVIGRTERIIEMATHTADPLASRIVHECRLIEI